MTDLKEASFLVPQKMRAGVGVCATVRVSTHRRGKSCLPQQHISPSQQEIIHSWYTALLGINCRIFEHYLKTT